jgi:thiamine biosynthesis protein ThiS
MIQTKTFFLNGQKYCTTHDITIFDLLTYLNYNKTLLVLEYNHSICSKENWKKIVLTNKDKLEIVTIVGGG